VIGLHGGKLTLQSGEPALLLVELSQPGLLLTSRFALGILPRPEPPALPALGRGRGAQLRHHRVSFDDPGLHFLDQALSMLLDGSDHTFDKKTNSIELPGSAPVFAAELLFQLAPLKLRLDLNLLGCDQREKPSLP